MHVQTKNTHHLKKLKMELEFQKPVSSLWSKLNSIRFRFEIITNGRKFLREHRDCNKVTFLGTEDIH
jgi:hypothetical protein